jgi:hypothetical protein
MAKNELPTFDSRVHIHVTSYRKRRSDPDGCSIKAVLDGLVEIGILRGDSWEEIASITFESLRSKEERTVIVLEDDSS